MKVTRFSGSGKSQKYVELSELIESMKTEAKGMPVSSLRENLKYCIPGSQCAGTEKVPVVVFGGMLNQVDGLQVMNQYSGLVLLEVNNLANTAEAYLIRKKASALLQTLAAFVGSGGKSVKILVPFTLPDGSLPRNPEMIALFHAHTYKQAAVLYEGQLKRKISLKEPLPERGCRLSYDPDLYFNPDAVCIGMEQPMDYPLASGEQPDLHIDPLRHMMPGLERSRLVSLLFENCYKDALDSTGGSNKDEAMKLFLIRLAENCFRSGIPEEDVLRWTLVRTFYKAYETEIRSTIVNVYQTARDFGRKPCINTAQSLARQTEDFMRRRFDLRDNQMSGDVEFRERGSYYFHFSPITPRALNSICLKAHDEGIEIWDVDVKRYIHSDKIPLWHPIDDYLNNLPQWDGEDRIRPLADSVPCSNQQWRDLFYIWFLSMVAHWKRMDQVHANTTLPLLTGDQGFGKSTWCRNLLPEDLRRYYTDGLDFSNKRKVELSLSRFALINIDEFDSISPSNQSYLKHIIQKPVVNSLQPYSQSLRTQNRYASFIATCNNFDLLTDPTGSRRYLCIEITDVISDISKVNHAQLYAQAVAALRAGDRYWFTREEEMQTVQNNSQFQQTPLEEQLFHQYFRAPESGEPGKWLSAIEILQFLQKRSSVKISNTSMSLFGRLLQKNKIFKKHTNMGNQYWILFKDE